MIRSVSAPCQTGLNRNTILSVQADAGSISVDHIVCHALIDFDIYFNVLDRICLMSLCNICRLYSVDQAVHDQILSAADLQNYLL